MLNCVIWLVADNTNCNIEQPNHLMTMMGGGGNDRVYLDLLKFLVQLKHDQICPVM